VPHGPELAQLEGLAVQTRAGLPEEHGAAQLDPNQQGDDRLDRQRDHEDQRREDDIEDSLERVVAMDGGHDRRVSRKDEMA
jgi:hypothetical protein